MPINDPRDIPGLVAWYSAEAITALADGDQIATWSDLSGNGNHATAASGSSGIKPKWRAAAGSAGGPAVHFTAAGFNFGGPGTGDGYFTLPANLMGSAAAGEIAMTVRQDAAANRNGLLWLQTESGYSGSHYPFETNISEGFGRNGGQRQWSPTLSLIDWRRYNVYSAAGDWQAFLDGTSQKTDTGGSVAWPAAPLLGATVSGGQIDMKFQGWMGAVVLYGRKLTTTERTDLDAWLAANPSGGTTALAERTMTLAGQSQARVGAFELSAPATVTLAGQAQRRIGAFDLATPATMTLAATSARRVGAFAGELSQGIILAGATARRAAVFVGRAETPITPAPSMAAAHAVVAAQSFGPVTMNGSRPTYSITQATLPRARQRIVVDGLDVTYFRGCLTPPVSYTLLEPLLFGPATLDLPQIAACFERPGYGDLAWLRPGAPVEVQYVLDDVVTSTAWKGVVVAFDTSGRNLSVELGGEASGRAALRNRQVPIFPRVNDLGRQMSDAITDLGLPFLPHGGPVTGIETLTTGGTGHLEHIQGLVAKAWTRAGRQWTVMPDEVTGVYEAHRKDTTTIHGTVFLDDARTVANLRRDIAEEPNRIYGTGVTPAGQRVRNGVYPGLIQGRAPDFPGHMQMGDTGDGVRLLIGRLHAMGYLKLTETDGGYDQDVYDAVVDLQIDAGLFDDGFTTPAVPGEVGIRTWEALYDLNVTGMSLEWAHIEPMAQRRKVRPWNRSGSGTIMGVNPHHDPEHLVRDRNVDLGAGMNRSQMREFARTALHDSDDPNWVGDITFGTGALVRGNGYPGMPLTPADVMPAIELRPGMNLELPLFAGGIVVHVSAIQVTEDGIATATVDTRARDAMEVWEVIARNKESRRDPARRRNQRHRSSTIVKDSIGEWDEIGGLLGNDVQLDVGWNVFQVVAAAEGTISRLRLVVQTVTSDGGAISIEGHEFACAVFGRSITPGRLSELVANPLTNFGAKQWEKKRSELKDHWLLYSSGTKDEPCGYSPGRKLERVINEGTDEETTVTTNTPTGMHEDDAGFAYRSESRTVLHVAVWVGQEASVLGGRVMWPQLEAGV